MISIFWCCGAIAEGFLAWTILPAYAQEDGWRYLVFCTALPLLGVYVLYFFLPESPRWLLAQGRIDEAQTVFNYAAHVNGNTIALEKLRLLGAERTATTTTIVSAAQGSGGADEHSDGEQGEGATYSGADETKGSIADLFNPVLRRTTTLLWIVWFGNITVYYGILLLTPNLFAKSHDAQEEVIGVAVGHNPHTQQFCSAFSDDDYYDVFLSSVGELPGILLTIWLINVVGRKRTMAFEFIGTGVCLFLISFRTSRLFEMFLLFLVRAFVSGSFQCGWLYTSEIYPTFVRSTGLGMASSVARIGGMITPFIAQGLADYSLTLALAVYGTLAVAAGAACGLLPIETRGAGLIDSLADFERRAYGKSNTMPSMKNLRRRFKSRRNPMRKSTRRKYRKMLAKTLNK